MSGNDTSTDGQNSPTAASEGENENPSKQDNAIGDAGKEVLKKERASRQKAEDNASKATEEVQRLKKKLQDYEDLNKTELQRALDQAEAQRIAAEEAQKESAQVRKEWELDKLKTKIADEKKVPSKLLHGDTREELEESAETVLGFVQSLSKVQHPAPGLKHTDSSGEKRLSLDTGRARAAVDKETKLKSLGGFNV